MEGCGILDLSNKGIKKLDKATVPVTINSRNVISLNLSGNCLQRLDNIDMFTELIELNASRNQLLRMYHVIRLRQLVKINLSNNHILSIEGLRELKNLKYLNLSHNNIKVIDSSHMMNNSSLQHLDLSHNSIMHITNIAHLTALKILHLHKNQIVNLQHCEFYLPGNLEHLTLANNNLTDLNEISHLVQLCNLKEISISGNPCVSMTGNNAGFDYRPFVLNWCTSVRVIDGYAVDDLESLRAEWLYSQGKGRKFLVGEHSALVQYLIDTCPMSGKALESENERKLRLILSKAQQHQKQLSQEQPNIRRSSSRRSLQNLPQSIMTRSLDPGALSRKTSTAASDCSSQLSESIDEFTEKKMTRSSHWPDSSRSDTFSHGIPLKHPFTNGEPLPASTALVPAPDSLISPSIASSLPFYSSSSQKSDKIVEDDSELCPAKLKTIKTKAYEKEGQAIETLEKKKDLNEAATCIQKVWRGYQTRVLNRRVSDVYQQIQSMRFNQYIKKLAIDMEATRAALDKEHQLQVLQMEAINALWKKISMLQISAENSQNSSQSVNDKMNLKTLAITCSHLDSQVQKLQNSMQEIFQRINTKTDVTNSATSTQTEIVAVHTPKDDSKLQFPYHRSTTLHRPSSLALNVDSNVQLSNCIPSDSSKKTTTLEEAPSDLLSSTSDKTAVKK